MAKLRIQCLVCRKEYFAGEDQIKANAYRCQECGLQMDDYQWALCKSVLYTAICVEKKLQCPVEVRLFSHECVFDDI